MFTVTQIKDHLTGMGHGGTLNKVKNIEAMFERSASRLLLKTRLLESIRIAGLASPVHDDVFNYALPSDFLSIIDLIPQDNRSNWDSAVRNKAGDFDLKKATRNKTISIEGSEGSKIIRINWRSRQGKLLHGMDSVTANGTWSAVTGASNVEQDTVFKKTGSASIRFDLTATGGGIQNSSMSAVDFTDEDEVADVFVDIYLPSISGLTSISAVWGNDLSSAYWTSVAQTTQADGTALRVGWNRLKFPWSTASETGTVAPATVDSFKLTFAGSTAISNIRVDNIIFSIGRNFDIKYYSKYLFKSASSGAWISQPTSNDDYVIVDNDNLPLYLMELLVDMAHQVEGTDSAFDMGHAENQLRTLFPAYTGLNPSMDKKATGSYGGLPRFRR